MSSKPSIFADPNAALRQARQLLGSDPEGAVRQARQLLQLSPHDPALLRLLAAGLRRSGKAEEADQAERDAISASTRNPAHREAARAVAGGQKERAEAILRALLARDEDDVVALVMLGLQKSTDGEYDEAEPLLRNAVHLAPSDPSARLALAEHLQRAKQAADAIEQLDQLDEASGQTTAALSLRAAVLKDLGRQEEEVEILKRLLKSDPKTEGYRVRLGHAYRTLGRTKDAVAAYREILAKYPFEGTSWWSLANMKTTRFSDEDIATMERGLAIKDAPLVNHIRLNFTLGKAHEDRGDVEKAFHHYAEGNRLRSTISTYKPAKITSWVERSTALFTPKFFAEREGAGFPARDPIFIVGMQRSGSTLVEQILASHPDIEGTAELTDMPNVMREIGDAAARRKLTFHEHFARLSTDDLRRFGESYIERTRVHRIQDRPFFTDKMPNNWMYVGIIRLILPNARIVDVRRHPLACGFSNWKQLYGKGLEHTYSMETMALYYAEYVRLMRHFDDAAPGAVHRVIYERMVDDVEGEVRKLLDYLGLPFDEACLDFHKTERSVRTISAEQVRRPINRSGVDQWRSFEQWLGPMKEALGPTLDDWDK